MSVPAVHKALPPVDATTMIIDLRNFTPMSDALPRDELIALLNDEVPSYTRIEALRLLGKVAPEGHDLAALVPYLSQPQFRSDTIDALVAMSSTSAQNILESQLDHGTNQDHD